MSGNKSKWLFYTVAIGALPMIIRFAAWLFSTSGHIDLFILSDLVYFGLILHISTLNEMGHVIQISEDWKVRQTAMSVVFIAFYSAMYVFSLLPDVFSSTLVTLAALPVTVISLGLGYAASDKLSSLTKEVNHG
jgi:hypothetical protein